jgi:hypothetical protein
MNKKNMIVCFCCIVFFCGCIRVTKKTPAVEEYVFSHPEVESTLTAQEEGTLNFKMRRFTVDKPFDSTFFVYRYPKNSIQYDYYNRFAVSPEILMRQYAAKHLEQERFTGYVSTSKDGIVCPYEIRARIVDLSGDYREDLAPKASLKIRFSVLDVQLFPSPVVFNKEYAQTVELENKNAAALIKGWQRCLTVIMDDFSNDLRAALQTGSDIGME